MEKPQQIPPNPTQPLGPRPLPFHLSGQLLTLIQCLAALPHWKNGSLSLSGKTSPHGQAKSDQENDLRAQAGKIESGLFAQAVGDEIGARLKSFCHGFSTYQNQPRHDRPIEPPVVAQFGSARLLDYNSAAGPGKPVLIIPSLINRAYILDLMDNRSLVRWLANQGLRPLLVDWGQPGATEAGYDLTAYITGPLQYFYDQACDLAEKPPSLVGYCMGGLLALALAGRNPNQIKSLALLATPWNFHDGIGVNLCYLQSLKPGLEILLNQLGNLPVDLLQAMFTSLDPSLTSEKFRKFARMDRHSDRARIFVALEDWLNDGVPLVAPVARDCLFEWYLENSPGRGRWMVDGQSVSPSSLTCPSLTLIPQQDHIVPPGSALALAKLLPHNENRWINAGHIGMVAGSHAKSTLYEPLGEWIKSHMEG